MSGAVEGVWIIQAGVFSAPSLPGHGAGHGPALLERAASVPVAAAVDGQPEPLWGDLPAGAIRATPFVCLLEN